MADRPDDPKPARPVLVISPSGRESVQTKARRYLAEGRVTVTARTLGLAVAVVRGTDQRYTVRWDPLSGWSCSCPAVGRCAHGLAVALVVEPDETGGAA